MQPQINVITLAVENLERSLKFYRDGLGFPTKGIVGTEYKGDDNQACGAVAMFNLTGGLLLALYPRTELAKDSNLGVNSTNSIEFSLGYLTKSRDEVDKILELAREAGGEITDAAHERSWGIYSGYFKDLDGHLREVIWNPPT